MSQSDNSPKTAPWQFKPGQSGNPGGRRKDEFQVGALARQYTKEAMDTLVRALKSQSDRVRVSAAEAILNRGWGMPKQNVDLNHNLPASAATDEALLAIALRGSRNVPAPQDDPPKSEGMVH